jgi:hypothetical protein
MPAGRFAQNSSAAGESKRALVACVWLRGHGGSKTPIATNALSGETLQQMRMRSIRKGT